MSDSATTWTAAYQAPPSMGFSRQEYWSGVPLPSPEKNHEEKVNTEKIERDWGVIFGVGWSGKVVEEEEIVLSSQLNTTKVQAPGPRDLRSREFQAEGIESAKALGQESQWYFRMRKKEELG